MRLFILKMECVLSVVLYFIIIQLCIHDLLNEVHVLLINKEAKAKTVLFILNKVEDFQLD